MSVYKRGSTWSYHFNLKGQHIQGSTGLRNRQDAIDAERDRRKEVRDEYNERQTKAKDLGGCDPRNLRRCAECETFFLASPAQLTADPKKEALHCSEVCEERWRKRRSPVPTLREFLTKQFLPFAETAHSSKPATLRYYRTGASSLLAMSNLADLRLDKITNEHATHYAARLKKLSPSTINCGLRTLRRAIYLASEWGVSERRQKIQLAKGERWRERVLSDAEIDAYLSSCEMPWKDAAIVLLGTGMRPGEAFSLRWEHVLLNGTGGMLQITAGKSQAARRVLPMVPAVHKALTARYTEAKKPERGWVFPAETKSGHLEGYCAKNQHAAALRSIKKAADEAGIETPVRPFPPYTMRHTALTRLADSGCDAFTLAKIAGHSSITITQRYCHPQAEAVQRAFDKVSLNALPA
jgi:integrase